MIREVPDNTAVRVALWRALHVLADAPPHVLQDEIGLALVAPPADWRLALARAAGFRDVQHVSADGLSERYFAGNPDGMRLPRSTEELLVATP